MLTPPSTAPEKSPLGSLEAENELRQFLKIARPEWSKPRRGGGTNVARVLAKLKAIDVTDIDTLVRVVDNNTINQELVNKRLLPLSREALAAIRKRRTFLQALESVDVPNIRQVGAFDPVAQMLSRKSLARKSEGGGSSRSSGGLKSSGRICSDSSLHGEGSMSLPPMMGLSSCASWSSASQLSSSQSGHRGLRGARQPERRIRHRRKEQEAAFFGRLGDQDGSFYGADGQSQSPRSTGTASPQRPRALSSSKAFSVTWSEGRAAETEPSELGGPTSPAVPSTRDGLRGTQRSHVSSRPRTTDAARADTPTSEEILSLHRAGNAILKNLEEGRSTAARWSQRSVKSPLEQGEDMLREQQALDDRERLVRQVSAIIPDDNFRSHIANNIKLRFRSEGTGDVQEGLAIDRMTIDQTCMNVRKQLAGMLNARKEIIGLRVKAHALLEELPAASQ